jgi:hypothetical protein
MTIRREETCCGEGLHSGYAEANHINEVLS